MRHGVTELPAVDLSNEAAGTLDDIRGVISSGLEQLRRPDIQPTAAIVLLTEALARADVALGRLVAGEWRKRREAEAKESDNVLIPVIR